VDAGICREQVNNFLSSLNIHPVRKHMLNERFQEAGYKIEEIAKHHIHESGQKSQMTHT
jgi:hypothetical protein